MDIVTSAIQFLKTFPEVTAALGSDKVWTSWLFDRRLYARYEGTSKTAVVLSTAGGWTSPNAYSTVRFPRLRVEIYTDPTRDGAGAVVTRDAEARALDVFDLVDRRLHNTSGHDVMWGGQRVIASTRLSEPEVFDVPDGDGAVRCEVYYGLGVG